MKSTFNYFLFFLVVGSTVFGQVPNYVPTSGLQGWWPFTGNANDYSQNAFNGTVNGATLTTDRFGAANSAYSFANGTSNISTTWPCVQGNNPRSFSLWFQSSIPLTGSSTELALLAYGQLQAGKGIAIVLFANNQPGIDINSSYVAYNKNTLGPWHHLVLTYDPLNGSNVLATKMYIDGELQTDISRTFQTFFQINTGSSINLLFGSTVTAGQFFNGKIDDIGVWDRALTQQEITNLFASITNVDPIEINLNGIKIYPNPSTTSSIIEGDFFSGDSYTIIDAKGKRYKNSNLLSGMNSVSVLDLPSGLYFFAIKKNKKSYFQKFVKY